MYNIYDKVGADFILSEDGDLAIDPEGQIEISQGTETITAALVRRLATDYNGYARYVSLGDNLTVLNSTYGSSLTVLLSSPASNVLQDDVKGTVETAAKLESRVVVNQVELESTQHSNEVGVRLSFQVKPEFLGISSEGFQQVLLPLSV